MRIFLVLLVLALAPITVLAENESVLLIDMQRVIDEAVIGKAARNNVESESKKQELVLQKAKSELVKAKAEFEKQSALLSGDALEEKRVSLIGKDKEFQRMLEDARGNMERKSSAELGKVVTEIKKIVDQLATKRGADFVLERDRGLVLYADNSIDVSAEVIKALDDSKLGY